MLSTARQHRIPVRTRCHGQASCLMCKVTVREQDVSGGSLSAPNDKEIRKLGEKMLERGYRLACQTIVYGHAVVTLPEDPLQAVIRAKLAEQQEDEG